MVPNASDAEQKMLAAHLQQADPAMYDIVEKVGLLKEETRIWGKARLTC